MTLRAKLIGAFAAVAIITLVVSGIGFWQTQKLAGALYEVGVVRLPSIEALDAIFESKTALDASKRELLREALLFEDNASGRNVGDHVLQSSILTAPSSVSEETLRSPGAHTAWEMWATVLTEETRRQRQAWQRIDKAWRTYEPLPQSAEEARKWKEFVTAWQAWRASYEKVMALLAKARETGDRSQLAAARIENETNLYEPARISRQLLVELIAINDRIAEDAMQQSVASYRDLNRLGFFMLGTVVVSLAAAIACGILLSRLINRPLAQMATAFSRISAGDLDVQVPVESRDEIGLMAEAMNHMVDSLRTSELRFAAIFENSIDAIGVFKDGRLALANPPLLALFGYRSNAEVVGRPATEFATAESHAAIEDRMRRRTLGEKVPPMMEVTGVRKDGSHFAMEVQSALFVLKGENYIVAILRDVTDRNRAATMLAESTERLQLAVRTSKLGVWRRHLITQTAEWDPRMFEIFGLPPSSRALTREEVLNMVVPEDRESARRIWRVAAETGQPYVNRFRIVRPDGQVRHVEAQGIVHANPGAEPEWAVGVTGDITEIVEATAESARLREQLLQAQKMETLGTLSAGIAHDFNNLLTGINGFIELTSGSLPPDHEGVELLRQARQGTLSARELVRRILTFSRQAHTSNRVPLNLGQVTRETAALISAALPANVALALDLSPNLPLVLADSGQIQQVLMNLCTNGAHAIGTQPGTVRIGLEARSGRSGAAGVCLTVSDTGAGMDAATLKRVFEPFFTTKRSGEGTGLGLAIVGDIVAAHDGESNAASIPGRGTTFTIWFPAHTGTAVAPVAAKPGVSHRGNGQRILVVDDEPAISRVVQLALQRAGYQPEVYTSSPEAWETFARNPAGFQLLVIDQQMPGLSGIDFIARARGIAPALPVIRMSGRFERETVAPFGDGSVSQLKKPFEIAELVELVGTILPP